MKIDYQKLLDNVYKELPEKAKKGGRFVPPTFSSSVQGSQTVIANFADVCNTLRREQGHLLKYLTKELATAGSLSGRRATLQGKFNERLLNLKLKNYIDDYIFCKECKKSDTVLKDIDRIKFMVCEACGARSPVKPLK